MTTRLAIYLIIVILVALGIDAVLFGWSYSLFLAKKFLELIEYVAFWR